jgi:hypothetical protein
MGLPLHAEIVAEPALAGHQPGIFLAPQRLSDGGKFSLGRDFDNIVQGMSPMALAIVAGRMDPGKAEARLLNKLERVRG